MSHQGFSAIRIVVITLFAFPALECAGSGSLEDGLVLVKWREVGLVPFFQIFEISKIITMLPLQVGVVPISSHMVAIFTALAVSQGPWGHPALRRLLYVRNHLLHLFDPGCQLPSHLPLESCRWMELDQQLINRGIIGEASLTITMEHGSQSLL